MGLVLQMVNLPKSNVKDRRIRKRLVQENVVLPQGITQAMLNEYSLRPLMPVALRDDQECNIAGEDPEIIWVALNRLFISDDYQRDLAQPSMMMIRRIALNWDWNKFKVLSLAPSPIEGYYEVVDGQHSAIAALTNGSIKLLPGCLNKSPHLKEKAEGFIGINKNRIRLSPNAIFNAQIAAQDENAVSVYIALQSCGIKILDVPPYKNAWKVGETMALASIQGIYTRGDMTFLKRVLSICTRAECAPIGATLLKALADVLPKKDTTWDDQIVRYIQAQNSDRLEILAKGRTSKGDKVHETLANMIRISIGIPKPTPTGRIRSTMMRSAYESPIKLLTTANGLKGK